MVIEFTIGKDERLALACDIADQIITKLQGCFSGAVDEVMTVKGVANFLQVSEDWVYKQVGNYAIPVTRAGKNLRFQKKAILKWLDEQTSQPLQSNPATRKLQELRQRNEDYESSALH